jgi:hypothetical protein
VKILSENHHALPSSNSDNAGTNATTKNAAIKPKSSGNSAFVILSMLMPVNEARQTIHLKLSKRSNKRDIPILSHKSLTTPNLAKYNACSDKQHH